jgi:2-polyprenyl-6-methoxyphenol hydroxylase-like FAD-dependent oxidoreductase
MSKPNEVLIIGGGIAGPALALFLDKAGIRASVYEAASETTSPIGGGFQIAPNGMNVLAALGLADALVAEGSRGREACFRDHQGKLLGRFENGNLARQGQPAVNATRARLQQLLRDEARRRRLDMRFGKRLQSIERAGARVIATFEDGSRAEGDLLVGADGVGSRVRALALPEAPPPAYLGSIAFGGQVAPEAVAAAGLDGKRETMTFMMGSRGQFAYASFSSRETCWWWWCHVPQQPERSREEVAALTADEVRRLLLERFAGWASPVEAFIASSSSLFKTNVYEVGPLPRWHDDRIVLIGDAAHAMSSSAGQGASLALEDAMCLAKLVRDARDEVTPALATFERMRRRRAEKTVAEGRLRESRQHAELGPVGTWLRNRMLALVLPRFGERSMRFWYDYRLAWEP